MKLTDIYTEDELNQEDELLFHVASDEALVFDFEVRTLSHASLAGVMTHRGDASVIDSMSLYATQEQLELIAHKVAHFDEARVLVMEGESLVDGNHHLAAAHRAGRDVFYIDLGQSIGDPQEIPSP